MPDKTVNRDCPCNDKLVVAMLSLYILFFVFVLLFGAYIAQYGDFTP